MGTGAAEICTSVTASGKYRLVCPKSVESTVLHVECYDTDALAVLHYEIKGKEFDEEVGVVTERLAIEGMQKGVTSSIGGSSATIGLTTLAIL